MSEDVTGRLVAAIGAVPAHDESPAAAEELCRKAGFDEAAAAAVAPVLIRLLESFGGLRSVVAPDGRILVKADQPNATLFLRSLAEHLRTGQPLLENWGRSGTHEPPYTEQQALEACHFLYLMERRRLRANPNAPVLRHAEVAQVLIGRRGRGHAMEYLLLHDGAARQYQLPGGRRRDGDRDATDVAVRELQEELPGFEFDPARDRLVPLGTARVVSVSRTVGVATEYDITVFHLRSDRMRIDAGPGGRWVGERTLLTEGAGVDGRTTNLAGLRMVADAGGMRGLEPSLRAERENPIVVTAKARPMEFWGLVVGVLGLVLTVVFYVV